MRTQLSIPYVKDGNREQRFSLYLPDTDNFPLLVYFHGGGLVHGGSAMRAETAATFVKYGVGVCSIGYRIYPEASYPDFIRDAAMGVAYIKKHLDEYGGDGRIFIGGTSAGAYLSMMLAFDPRWLGIHNLKATDFAGFIHHTGQPTTHFNVLRERGLDRRRIIVDEAAPLYHITDTTYPPMLFTSSDGDSPARLEQNRLVIATLSYFGHDMSRFPFLLESGKHCATYYEENEDGDNIFALHALEFMKPYL